MTAAGPEPPPGARVRAARAAAEAAPARSRGRGRGDGRAGAGRGADGRGRGTGRAGRFTLRQARRAASAEGAGDSGLSRLIEMHAFNTAGDAAVAISLAGTLFFQVPTGEARGQVALFLGLTMLPFAIVAPLLGPFLDRFSHGRRWAIGATMAIRAFLCWGLATAVTTDSTWLFPAALGVPGLVQGVRRHPRRRRPPPAPGRPHPGQGQRPHLAGRHRRAPRISAPIAGARLVGRAGVVAALRVRAVRAGHDLGDPAARARSTPTPARTRPCCAARARSRRAARGCGSPARCPSPCGPTAARAGSRAS